MQFIVKEQAVANPDPDLKFCPYYSSTKIKMFKSVPRCMACRAVFFVNFRRYLRKSPRGGKFIVKFIEPIATIEII